LQSQRVGVAGRDLMMTDHNFRTGEAKRSAYTSEYSHGNNPPFT